jgi:hypothetical protein
VRRAGSYQNNRRSLFTILTDTGALQKLAKLWLKAQEFLSAPFPGWWLLENLARSEKQTCGALLLFRQRQKLG